MFNHIITPHYKYTLCHHYSKGADSITSNVSVKGIPKVSVSPLSVSKTEGMECIGLRIVFNKYVLLLMGGQSLSKYRDTRQKTSLFVVDYSRAKV